MMGHKRDARWSTGETLADSCDLQRRRRCSACKRGQENWARILSGLPTGICKSGLQPFAFTTVKAAAILMAE